jgi:hypothetical protein
MRQRFDAGTGLVALGAALLLVSLFLDWYDPGAGAGPLSAWDAFEVVDLLLAFLAFAAIAGALEATEAGPALSRGLPVLCGAAAVIVAVELINQPPAAFNADLDTGAWVALGSVLAMLAGAVLRAARISVVVDVQSRERRRRVAAVDRRDDPPAPGEAPTSVAPARSRPPAPDPGRTQPLDALREDLPPGRGTPPS